MERDPEWGPDLPPTTGSATTHATARKRLRQRLEAEGYPPEEIVRLVEEKRAAQGRVRWPQQQQPQPRSSKKPKKSWTHRRGLVLAKRDGEFCHWCGAVLDVNIREPSHPSPPRATLDHVIPRSAGGSYALTNLVLSCEPCNAERGGVHRPGGFPKLVGLPSAKGKRSL